MNLDENEKMEIFLSLDQDQDGKLTKSDLEQFLSLILSEVEENTRISETKRLSFTFDHSSGEFVTLHYGQTEKKAIHSGLIHSFDAKKIKELRQLYFMIDHQQNGFFSMETMNKGMYPLIIPN